ncbi:MAG: ABC transporter substrate-binding protein [Gemmatimonadota bacterium]
MSLLPGGARALPASGRFAVSLLVLSLLAGGCRLAGPRPSGPERLPEPILAPGTLSADAEAEAAELYGAARRALAERRLEAALGAASRVVDEFPGSKVSGAALRMVAETSFRLRLWEEAARAADTYASLLPDNDPRAADLRLLEARALKAAGRPVEALHTLLRLGRGTGTNLTLQATGLARDLAQSLSPQDLARVVGTGVPEDAVVAPTLLARFAYALWATGDSTGVVWARRALARGARGPDSVSASMVLDPNARPPARPGSQARAVALGVVLPRSGSPALQEFAALIAEGVEVAAVEDTLSLRVRLDMRDDGGDPERTSREVRALETEDVLGVVGFLQDEALLAAGQARRSELPLISPTARTAEEAGPFVFSLEGPDPLAAAAMARYAAEEGYARVAIIHSRAPISAEEADVFRSSLTAAGVPVAGSFAYDVGATFFQEQIKGARDALRAEEIAALELGPEDTLHVELLDRVALFLPIPPEDVEYLAPQITHFGLDTLGIEILGTSGWTQPQVLEVVDPRHTTGVVATAPVSSGPGTPGHERFRRVYEDHFQRTLVSPVPALGYDAALLFLAAAREGATTPQALRVGIRRIRGLQGATGIFSVLGGRVLREQHIVRILNGALVPLP